MTGVTLLKSCIIVYCNHTEYRTSDLLITSAPLTARLDKCADRLIEPALRIRRRCRSFDRVERLARSRSGKDPASHDPIKQQRTSNRPQKEWQPWKLGSQPTDFISGFF